MRVVPWMIVLGWVGLGLAGCSSLSKKNGEGSRPGSAPGKQPAAFPGGNDPLFQSSPKGPPAKTEVGRSEIGGILAGTIFDPYDRPAREAYIRYVCLDDAKQEEAPIDVAVDGHGAFQIQSLQPHKRYKLVARAKQGDKLIAAIHYVTTPDIHVNIRLREDFAASGIPDLPGPPAYTPKKAEPKKAEPKKSEPKKEDAKKEDKSASAPPAPQAGWNTAVQTPAGAQLGAPRPEASPQAPPTTSPTWSDSPGNGWVPGIAEKAKNWPPVMEMPRPSPGVKIEAPKPLADPPSPAPSPAPSLPRSGDAGAAASQTRVPSCILLGRHLKNLALYDTAGQTWEFQTSRKGKLVLLDFWGTWCHPCREALPQLQALQTRYPTGLEVIGIAYEQGGSRQDQATRVNNLCQRVKASYRQLLGGGMNCPVQSQFDIRAYPTMLLLDESGEIIWRHEGRLDPESRESLELLIQRKLGTR